MTTGELKQKLFNRETVTYIIAGVLTTLVSYVSFFILKSLFENEELFGKYAYLAANIIASVLAIIFAFFVNKLWVFESKSWEGKTVLREGLSFAGARTFSFVLEQVLMYLLVTVLFEGVMGKLENPQATGFMKLVSYLVVYREGFSKIVVGVVVVVLNYFLSKFLIFTKKEKTPTENDI